MVGARRTHVGPIANRMREIDRTECAAFGRSPREALRLALGTSLWALTAMVDGKPHAMFGIFPRSIAEGVGVPWFLGSDEVYRHPREWFRTAPSVLDAMHNSFPVLENVMSARNDQARAILTRLGFEFGEGVTSVRGVDFVNFRRGRCAIPVR